MTGSRVRLEIPTAMAEAVINRACAEGIRFLRAEKSGNRLLTVWIPAEDEARLGEFLTRNTLTFRVTGRAGLARGREFLRRRLALGVTLLAAGLVLLWISSRVWVVSVRGALPGDEARVIEILDQMGVGPGTVKRGLDFLSLRRALEAEMPEYAFFGVKTLGVTLSVQAVYADQAPEVYEAARARDLVADADGVVLFVHVAAGQALVKPGDTVRRGDTLIRGEERKRVSGETTAVRAEGSVVARLWTEATARVALTKEEECPTGRVCTVSRLETPFFTRVLAGENPFARFRETRRRSGIVGLFLPVGVVQYEYTETEPVQRAVDPLAARAAAEALARAQARKIAPAGAAESKSWTEYQTDGAVLTARVVMEWTKEIARGAQGG